MNTAINRARSTGLAASGLTATAGMSELIAGSNRLTGDKSEPTTLGVLTVILAVIMAVSALLIRRAPTNASSMASAAGMTVPALLTLTTAGILAIPGAVIGVAAGAIAVADARNRGSIRHTISQAWPAILIGILAAIYLAFGAVAGPTGWLGIIGAAAAVTAFALKQRSAPLATVILIVGVVPFAIAAWWSVVIPLTALLLLTVELPHILGPRRSATAL